MSNEPKVTGLSPMTGPPGTKVTVRGENLGKSGEDIVELTVNGADCLPFLEWKSPKKIVVRCGRAIGSGDIIITTESGGVGSCDVKFNCYEEQIVSPTQESNVWVNEVIPEKEKLIAPGISEEYAVDVSSPRFSPAEYVVRNYANASLHELAAIKSDLQTRCDPEVISSNSNRAALLKSHLPVIMECLQILEHLSKVIITSRDASIDNITKSIRQSLGDLHDLYDPLFVQKDLLDSIENAMQVFQQNETLFNLPSAIETSIKNRNYDSVVKEISGVLIRLKTINIDPILLKGIQEDVNAKINNLKMTIKSQLDESCHSVNTSRDIDEVKRLITHLNRLGEPADMWTILNKMLDSIEETLSERNDHFIDLDQNMAKSVVENIEKTKSSREVEAPNLVQFVQCAMSIFQNTFYDTLKLSQSYFDAKDEYACRESDQVRDERQEIFNKKVSERIEQLRNLLRQALVPDSASKAEATKYKSWPVKEPENYVDWLKPVLQSVITCHIHLTKVHLPPNAREELDKFKEFVSELRLRSMEILFKSAARSNKLLYLQEDWVTDVNDAHPGITKLPSIFEKNILDTLKFANENIFEPSFPGEKSILKGIHVQATFKTLALSLINSFIESLSEASKRETNSHKMDNDLDRVKEFTPQMQRLLTILCNCHYTKDRVFVRLQSEFEKLQDPKMDTVFKQCRDKYNNFIETVSKSFRDLASDKLNKPQRGKKTVTNEDIQMSLMMINSQIFLIAPQLVNGLMTSIVNDVFKNIVSSQTISQKL